MKKSLEKYADDVRNLKFPSTENFYKIKDEELEKLLSQNNWKVDKI